MDLAEEIANLPSEDKITQMKIKLNELEKIQEIILKNSNGTYAGMYAIINEILDICNIDLNQLILNLPVCNIDADKEKELKEARKYYIQLLKDSNDYTEELREVSAEIITIYYELQKIALLKDTELTDEEKISMLSNEG